ncbi:hypothetical protein G0U57_008318 [Chelydra serpentina]|uniref:Uncharacterized protein n=1 Tax=Chelydra serpentina TaxID=8475 RepID=A0A8T1RYC6_CHESE|nr:hypothetical protein G0U57_008318 [Chelydra serpentina]
MNQVHLVFAQRRYKSLMRTPRMMAYADLRGRLHMELTEPVPHHEHKKVMQSIVRVAVHAVLHHCLREKLFEDGMGCVIDAPAQRHHDCVSWTSEDINCKLWALCTDLFGKLLKNCYCHGLCFAMSVANPRKCSTRGDLGKCCTIRSRP